jgi:hypothetical protein
MIQHSTINGNERATRRLLDHGLVCKLFSQSQRLWLTCADADYYFVEFGNEALKLAAGQKANGH